MQFRSSIDQINSDLFNDKFYDICVDHDSAIEVIELFTMLKGTIKSLRYDSCLKQVAFETLSVNLDDVIYNKNTHEYNYSCDGYLISFRKISDLSIFKDNRSELTSNVRYDNYYEKLSNIAITIPDSKVLSGYITYQKSMMFYSVIEFNSTVGDAIILDWSRNLLMRKEYYCYLMNFKELSVVDSDKIRSDLFNVYKELPLDTRFYLSFREEILKDLEKNRFIFDNVDDQNKKYKKLGEV